VRLRRDDVKEIYQFVETTVCACFSGIK